LGRDAVIDALTRAEPEVMVHQLTAPAGFGDFRKLDKGFAAANRLRTEGTITCSRASDGSPPPDWDRST
jgi:2-alkyl-3-oxoalkanoate reductase